MQNALKQVLTLSEGTFKKLISRSYYNNLVFVGSDESSEYINQVRSELSSFIQNNSKSFNSWFDAFGAFMAHKRKTVGADMYQHCLAHAEQSSNLPSDFEIEIFGKKEVFKLQQVECFLSNKQHFELSKFISC
ncbi:hypothetical protein [Vibrio coralliilyticus]|uniref:Uncharacterized protein n=1 Tax=Vibrio coralliilyticus TaxID=190893 RepID=A0AAP7DEI3_9VIBR|nr:hypothetical protein [Vibrio coralliilyticus]NOI31992.1 hypothetical protein [Vibrio coralliilyticus]NOJ25193.1 hypothetical protein [Vibrio coralliilyticus]